MTITKSYITDETGKITSVILDYHTYKQIEELLLDQGLLNAMEELEDEETLDYEEVKDHSEIPKAAIDPYTEKKIHDLIAQGKRIKKCKACGTYYDKDILEFYGHNCAVYGCKHCKIG